MQANEHISNRSGSSMAPIGYLMVVLSILAFIALLHHPVSQGANPIAKLTSMRSHTVLDESVNATLAIIFGLLNTAMVLFSARLDLRRFTVALGLVAFASAFVLAVLAAMTDGFVVPTIVAGCGADPSVSCAAEAFTQLRLSGIQIEFLTQFSFVGIAIAVLAWSAALLSTRGVSRWAGLVGVASGTSQLALLWTTSERLTPASLIMIFAGQVIWYLLAAALMIIRRGPFETTARC